MLDQKPAPGRIVHAWRSSPPLVLSTFATEKRYFVLALEPGPGGVLRESARRLSIFIPVAGVALAILAALYLRSLLKPYERLLAAAGGAPAAVRESGDEREFVITRFEATIAALHDKERELERLARREKERADDLETAARTLSKNLPTGLLSVDPDGRVVELNEAGREILKLEREVKRRVLRAGARGGSGLPRPRRAGPLAPRRRRAARGRLAPRGRRRARARRDGDAGRRAPTDASSARSRSSRT